MKKDVKAFEEKMNESKLVENVIQRVEIQNNLNEEILLRLKGGSGQLSVAQVEEACKLLNSGTKALKADIATMKTTKSIKDGTL